jgi:hypothetical protein
MTYGTKYHPLFEHLLFSGQGQLSMTFGEIEALLGAPLPPSARQREEWWSNSASGHSQARAWMNANYKTSNVDLAGEKVDFRLEGWPEGYVKSNLFSRRSKRERLGFGESKQASYEAQGEGEPGSAESDHPLFGIWKGKVTLLPDHDYTKPAFEPDATP